MANSVVMIPFSASTQGMGISISATATPGTLIHTTGISATVIDRIYLWNSGGPANSDTVFEFGTASFPTVRSFLSSGVGLSIEVLAASSQSPNRIFAGQILMGDGTTGLSLRAYTSALNATGVFGYVLRITP